MLRLWPADLLWCFSEFFAFEHASHYAKTYHSKEKIAYRYKWKEIEREAIVTGRVGNRASSAIDGSFNGPQRLKGIRSGARWSRASLALLVFFVIFVASFFLSLSSILSYLYFLPDLFLFPRLAGPRSHARIGQTRRSIDQRTVLIALTN